MNQIPRQTDQPLGHRHGLLAACKVMTGRQMQNFVTISRRQLFKIEPVPNRRKRPAFAGSKTREIKCEAIAQKLDPNLIAKRIGDSAARVLTAFLVTFNPVFLGCL